MNIQYFKSGSTFVEGVVTSIHSRILKKNREQKIFRLALSGGRTPIPIYKNLTSLKDIDWSLIEIYIVDERYVPVKDKFSNYGMIKNIILDKVKPKPKCIFFDTSQDIEVMLEKYEKQIKTKNEKYFDLIVLGMGIDGHTASLFPGDILLKEKKRWVGHTKKGDPISDRMTLTFPAIEASEEIFVLARGREKSQLIRSISMKRRKSPIPIGKILSLERTQVFLEE